MPSVRRRRRRDLRLGAGRPARRRRLGGHARRRFRAGRPALRVGRRDAPAALLARRRRFYTDLRQRARAVARAGRRGAGRGGRGLVRPARRTAGRPTASRAARRRHPGRAADAGGDGAPCSRACAVGDVAFGLLEPEAGVLRAGDGVRALVARAREGGLQVVRGAGCARRRRRSCCRTAAGSRPTTSSGPAGPGSGGSSRSSCRCGSRARTCASSTCPPNGPPRVRAGSTSTAPSTGTGSIEPHGMKVSDDREGDEIEPGERPERASDASVARRPSTSPTASRRSPGRRCAPRPSATTR